MELDASATCILGTKEFETSEDYEVVKTYRRYFQNTNVVFTFDNCFYRKYTWDGTIFKVNEYVEIFKETENSGFTPDIAAHKCVITFEAEPITGNLTFDNKNMISLIRNEKLFMNFKLIGNQLIMTNKNPLESLLLFSFLPLNGGFYLSYIYKASKLN